MASEDKQQVSFKIIPDEDETVPRLYANFCSIQNSPFDFTLSFCDVHPLGDRELKQAQETGFVKAPVRARLVVPVQMLPGLITALQDNYRMYQESFGPPAGPLH